MGSDTKTEPGASPKVGFCGMLSDEVKAEVASLVQAALAQMQQPGYDCSIAKTASPVVEISPGGTESETERNYKELVSTLEAKLNETSKLLGSAYRDLSDARDQLEKQRAKSVQLEQRILQMSEVEGTFKSTLSVLRAEKDKALAREREALLNRDRAGMHHMQLSGKLSELQSNLDLKAAELNDAAYTRQQLENRVNELNKEVMSLRRVMPSQGASTGAQTQSGAPAGTAASPQVAQPPTNLCFSVPIAAARRHTAPNIYPPSHAAPTVPSSLPFNRPPKRSRADSHASDDSESTRSRVSSGGSMTFALRPVKPESAEPNQLTSTTTVLSSNIGHPQQYQAYSPVSPTAPISPYYPQQQRSTCAAPIPYQNQGSDQTQAVGPQGPSSAPPIKATTPIMRPCVPITATSPAQMAQPGPVRLPPSVQQFINQMFFSTPTGIPECKICKFRPLGPHVKGMSAPPSLAALLAHAEKHHGRTVAPRPIQQHQT